MLLLLLESEICDQVSDQPSVHTRRYDLFNRFVTTRGDKIGKSFDLNLKRAYRRSSSKVTCTFSSLTYQKWLHLLGNFTVLLSSILLLFDVLTLISGRKETDHKEE